MRAARELFLHACLTGAVSVGVGCGLALWSGACAAREGARRQVCELGRVVTAALADDGLPDRVVSGVVGDRAHAERRLRHLLATASSLRGLQVVLGDGSEPTWLHVGDTQGQPADRAGMVAEARRSGESVVDADGGTGVLVAALPLAVRASASTPVVLVHAAPALAAPPLSLWPFVLGLVLAGAGAGLARRRFGRPLAAIQATVGLPHADLGGLARGVDDLAQQAALGAGELEQRVQARTRSLLDLSRTQEEQVANTVHELRTPLTSIVASLEILHGGLAETESERQQFLDNALTASRHMTLLCNDILDAAAFEAGKLRMEVEAFPVHDLLADAERLMEPLARSRDVVLRVDGPPEPLTTVGDRNRVLQVVFNLVGNAIKFTPPGGCVVLRARCSSGMAAFEVEDDGLGVPLAARGRLFTKYGRVHEAAAAVPGTGIGLYLCRILVDSMGGSIGYEPREPQGGSVFWFTLPQHRPVAATAAAGADVTR